MSDVVNLFGRPLKIISRVDLMQRNEPEVRRDSNPLPEIESVNSDMPTSRHASVEHCDQPHQQPTCKDRPKPYITDYCSLVIQFDSDPRYHYWKGGQSLVATLQELGASEEMIRKYKSIYCN